MASAETVSQFAATSDQLATSDDQLVATLNMSAVETEDLKNATNSDSRKINQIEVDIRLVESSLVAVGNHELRWPKNEESAEFLQKFLTENLIKLLRVSDWSAVDKFFGLLENLFKQKPEEITKIVNKLDEENSTTALAVCVKQDRLTETTRLIQLGADVNFRQHQDGQTVLHIAASFSSAEMIEKLLEFGADPNVKDSTNERLPLHFACLRKIGSGPIVKSLISSVSGANGILVIDNMGFIPFWTAAETRNVSAMKELLTLFPDEQLTYQNHMNHGDNILHHMARRKEMNMMKTLLASGSSVNAVNFDGQTVAHLTVLSGNLEALELLLHQRDKLGLDLSLPDSNRKTVLQLAIETGQAKCVEILFRFSTPQIRTQDGKTLAHFAAQTGQVEMLTLLTDNHISINVPDQQGNLPIHLAALNGHVDFIKALINKKYSINVRNKDGMTPLHLAASHDQSDAVEILIGFGAVVNAKGGKNEETALHLAASSATGEKCVKSILLSGADLNVKSADGDTPLHKVAFCGAILTVRILLNEIFVDFFSQNKIGETALHSAVGNCHYEITKNLLEFISSRSGPRTVTEIINTGNKFGQTSMHYVSRLPEGVAHFVGEDALLARLLLDNGGDMGIFTKNDLETPFHYVARSGNFLVLEAIIDGMRARRNPSLTEMHKRSRNGFSPLLTASENGHIAVVDLLLQNRARTDVFDQEGRAALHLAAENGHLGVAEKLLRYNAFVNAKTNSGITAVHLAAQKGSADIVDLLIEGYQATADIISLYKRTPLHLAAQSGQTAICERLLELQADPMAQDQRGQTPLHLAASKGHAETVKLFLSLPDSGALIRVSDEFGFNAAHIAAKNGSTSVFPILLEADKNLVLESKIQSSDSTTLHLAAAGGYKEIVTILINAGASSTDENKEGMTPLHLAAREGHIGVLEALKYSVSLTICSVKTGLSALHIASFFGQIEFSRNLLSSGVPVSSISEEPTVKNFLVKETKSEKKMTALHFSCLSGHENMVRMLMLYPDLAVDAATATTGATALHLAAAKGHISVVHLLMGRANLNLRDKNGKNALMFASGAGFTELADLMLHQGGDVTAQDNNGWTALHYAAASGHLDTVKVLIGHGASTLERTKNGKTPLSLATSLMQPNILKFLLTKPHESFDLLQDEGFLYDLVICSKQVRQKPLQDFISRSPSPVEIALKISKFCSIRAAKEREREHDLLTAGAFCDTLAFELLSIACAKFNPAHVLRGMDQYGNTMVDILIDGDHKQVMAIPAVQRYFTYLWNGFQDWSPIWSTNAIFFAFFFFPPFWVAVSLPCGNKLSHIPRIKLTCHVISHVFFMVLLLLVFMFPVEKIYFRRRFFLTTFEIFLLIFIFGRILDEAQSYRIQGQVTWIRLAILTFSIIAVILHAFAFFSTAESEETNSKMANLFFIRNAFFSLAFFFSCIQIMSYLSIHPVFGPMGILIRDLLKDLFQFMAILGIFVFGFTFLTAALYLDTRKPLHGPHPNGTILDMTFDPWLSFQKLYYSFFDRIEEPEFPDVEDGPSFANSLVQILHMVYLTVVVIVLLKLLVATFTDTYKRINSRSDFEWKYGRARLITNMDRTAVTPPPLNLLTVPYIFLMSVFKQGGLRNSRIGTIDSAELIKSQTHSRASLESSEFLWKRNRRSTITGVEGSSHLLRMRPAKLIRDSIDWKAVIASYLNHPIMEDEN